MVKVKATIGDVRKVKLKEVTFIADSGAFNTIIPPSLAAELGLQVLATTEVMLADGRKAEAGVSVAHVKLLDRSGEFIIWIMNTPEPLLGTTVFEGLGLAIDPSTGEVRYSRSFGLPAL